MNIYKYLWYPHEEHDVFGLVRESSLDGTRNSILYNKLSAIPVVKEIGNQTSTHYFGMPSTLKYKRFLMYLIFLRLYKSSLFELYLICSQLGFTLNIINIVYVDISNCFNPYFVNYWCIFTMKLLFHYILIYITIKIKFISELLQFLMYGSLDF